MELLIQNALVLDGLGNDPVLGSVGVENGKIVYPVPADATCERVMDAKGLCLSPGWIDSHSHADNAVFKFPEQREKIEQGITFSVSGQCGSSCVPVVKEGRLLTAGEFFKEKENAPLGANLALQIGHNALRKAVMGTVNRLATREELEQMKDLLRDGLENGAIGLSFGLIYIPGCYSDMEECLALAKVVKEYDGILSAHLRDESELLLQAVEEFITVVRASGCRGVVSHHKAAGKANWGMVKESLAMIDRANREGCDIYQDVYPYTASHTTLKTRFIPKRFHPEGTTDDVLLLEQAEIREKIKSWGREIWGDDLGFTLITKCPSHPEYEGKNVNEIFAESKDADPYETVFRILWDDHGATGACFFTMNWDDVDYVISHPRSMVCTDSSVAKNDAVYHPRLRAAFPAAISRFVREKKLLSLPEMIRRMTSLPASVYRLENKGILADGMDADLVLFDPEIIGAGNDYANCTLPNKGLAAVIVDGKIVLENNEFNGTCAARLYQAR